MSNDNLAAESVASRILDLVAGFGQRGSTVTAESVLGRDLGLDYLDTVELIIDVEQEFDIDVSPWISEEDDEVFMLGLKVQEVIDATMKALAEMPPVLVPGSIVTLGGVEFDVSEESTVTAADGVMHARREEGFVADPLGGLPNVTFCLLILRNGTKVTGVNHGPVSNANFRAVEGRRRARANAIEKVWELEGYLLRERLANPTHITLNHLTAEQEADLVEALRNSPPGSLEVLADPDANRALAALRNCVDAMRAFTNPEGNMTAKIGEFNDLKAALVEAEGVLEGAA